MMQHFDDETLWNDFGFDAGITVRDYQTVLYSDNTNHPTL
jgi:hypothetical protein